MGAGGSKDKAPKSEKVLALGSFKTTAAQLHREGVLMQTPGEMALAS